MRKALIFIALCAILNYATASIVYKCEFRNAVSYSQTACADAQVLDLSDDRTAQQKAQADGITQRMTAQANALANQRQATEALAARQLADAARARQIIPTYETQPRHIVRRVVWSKPAAVYHRAGR